MRQSSNLMQVLDIAPAQVKGGEVSEADQKMVCLLVALGEPADAIARKVGLMKKETDLIITRNVEQIIRFQTAMFPDPIARVKRMAHMALDTQMKLLVKSTSDATVAKIASDILDRATGKATQVIESRNLNVAVTDMDSANRALKATEERIARLESVQKKIKSAGRVAAA